MWLTDVPSRRPVPARSYQGFVGGQQSVTASSLAGSSRRGYHPGRPLIVRALWLWTEALLLINPLVTSYRLKRTVLRAFGASVGRGVLIKPGVHIKHPWRLRVGDHCWIGERAWIDNLVQVDIADNVCISQDAYLCTGNHDWSDPQMGMTPAPITWITAYGSARARRSVLACGSASRQS